MKTLRLLSLLILAVLCLSACYGGYAMIADPSGRSLGLPFYLLHDTVFSNYRSIGWILLIVVGLFSFFTGLLVVVKSRIYSFFIILEGALLCIFIFVQLLLLRERIWIQFVFLATGILLIYLGALQNQRKIEKESARPNR